MLKCFVVSSSTLRLEVPSSVLYIHVSRSSACDTGTGTETERVLGGIRVHSNYHQIVLYLSTLCIVRD